jgi:hypothetical protein
MNDKQREPVKPEDHPDYIGGVVWSPLELDWINRRLALTAPVAPAEPPTITLSGAQLLEALDFVAPDRDRQDQLDQLESEVCISYRPAGIDTDGDPFEAGMCCWLSDYSEEGSIPLPGLIPTAPVAPAEPSDETVFKVARAFSDRTADECGVDRDDQWKIYGDSFHADVLFVLNAANVIKP